MVKQYKVMKGSISFKLLKNMVLISQHCVIIRPSNRQVCADCARWNYLTVVVADL